MTLIKVRLKELLNIRGITQTELSSMSGVRRARINEICSSNVKRLELDHINAICVALDVKPWEWIVWEPEQNQEVCK